MAIRHKSVILLSRALLQLVDTVCGGSAEFIEMKRRKEIFMEAAATTTIITAKVLNQTNQALMEQSDKLGLSVGEVLDRLFFRRPMMDSTLAASFTGDLFALVTSGQSDENLCQSALILISILAKTLLECGYNMEQITSEVTAWIAEQNSDAE